MNEPRVMPLSGNWEFRRVGEGKWRPARVPGSNFTDLQRAGVIPDPQVADNELKVQWVVESRWEYRKRFNVPASLLSSNRVFLKMDGVDTIAEIILNGRRLARVDNMFIHWEFEVKRRLRPGMNELLVKFEPPTSRASWKKRQPWVSWPNDMSLPGGPFVRKAPCQYGWDWGPKLPPVGLWRDVRLEGWNSARLLEVHPRQEHKNGGVVLRVRVRAERRGSLGAVVTLTAPCGKVRRAAVPLRGDSGTAEFRIESPALWWPNGHGEQRLYQLVTELRDGAGRVVDRDERKIGMRKLELRREKDRWGQSFTFVVNGLPLFAKGANWIPADSFPERVTPEAYRHLLGSARDSNMNIIRVWGGGFYENDIFYDLCDEMGILVWHDFMFACSQYPGDRTFQECVRREAVENIRRLRHHPCMAIWCGNNEMESGMTEWGWKPPVRAWQAYNALFHRILPDCVAREDPDTAYWPSSPSSGAPRKLKAGAETHGDIHDWSVWHGRKPFTVYREHLPRFCSEFGFQSLPEPALLGKYLPPAERNMSSYLMDHRQRSGSGNEIIIHFLSQNFRMPRDFKSLCYSTQLLQAEAMRYGVEHWRRNRARTSGAIYWQLDDCWPCPSWSSIDYVGNWKALQYFARKFYEPVHLSAEDLPDTVRLHVTNDTAVPFRGKVRWRLETLDGTRLARGAAQVKARPLADTMVKVVRPGKLVAGEARRRTVLVHELFDARGRLKSREITPFVVSKHLDLVDPALTAKVRARGARWAVTIRGNTLARFVELHAPGAGRVWDDNYFDLPARTARTVTCPRLPGESMAHFRKGLRLMSLWQAGRSG